MSKEIYLYSEDKKYKCAVELADSCDRFGCHNHSMIIITEERADGTYVIAQAKDRILETEKDEQISDLQHRLEVAEKALELACERVKYFEEMQDREMGHFELFGYDSNYDLQAIIEQYKQQAKEMLENE